MKNEKEQNPYLNLTLLEKYGTLLVIIREVPPVMSDDNPERDKSQEKLFDLAKHGNPPPEEMLKALSTHVDTYPLRFIQRQRSEHYIILARRYKLLNNTSPLTSSCKRFLDNTFKTFYGAGNERHPASIPTLTELANDKDAYLRKALKSGLSLHLLLGIDNPNEIDSYFNPEKTRSFEQRRLNYMLREIHQTQQIVRELLGPQLNKVAPTASEFEKACLVGKWRQEFINLYNDEP